jgi:23S rRNA (cytosine1962-C5)-methyltransferase
VLTPAPNPKATEAMKSRPLIRLKPREGNRARAGAPWIFSNEIHMDEAAKAVAPGSVVRVQADDGQSFGVGYFNPKTLIAVRLLDCPVEVAVDSAFLAARLARALALRNALFEKPYYRLVHAEGDGLPGLMIDRFGDICVVQVSTAGMEALLEPLLAALNEIVAPQTIILRADTPARVLEGLETYVRVAQGEDLTRASVEENGVRYFADMTGGQKTGWYYDQRDNRAFIASLAKGKSVLDAYCYTGGFAIAAARAGASEANGVDGSAPALALAEEAATANGVAQRCKFLKADVFEELERLAGAGEKFDIVAADPPPFVKARKDLEVGAKAYRKLARLAAGVTRPDGFLLLASCSHNIAMERFAHECAIGIARAGRSARLIRQAGAGPDHPVHPMLPESAYLKALVYALD